MKRLLLLALVSLLAAPWSARADGADDQYIRIFSLIQAGDGLNTAGQFGDALAKFTEAQSALQQFQKSNPDWNPKVVTFRLNDLAEKIRTATERAPAPAPSKSGTPATSPPAAPVVAVPTEQERQLAAAREDLRQLQSEKANLEAKLKEALAAQPAAVDSRELAKAQQRIQELMKENELLKATTAPDLTAATAALAPKNLDQARRALAESNRQLKEQSRRADTLATEKKALQKQLADTKSSKSTPAPDAEAARKLAAAETRLAALQSETEALRLEKNTLEARVRTLSEKPASAPTPNSVEKPPASLPADFARIERLEKERAELVKKLDAANKELQSRKGRAASARLEALTNQLVALRARVEIFEAKAVPYTDEELALFKPPETQLAATPNAGTANSSKKPLRTLPRGASEFVASAQRHFAAKEFDQAEADYQTLLKRDENNAYTLANLAAIQLERGHLEEAETNVTKALARAPDDAYALSVLGQIKFRQKKYDPALDALSRAATLDPQNAEIQNHLGLALGHKGLRLPAETALRRAITLDPHNASAHNNLAMIYATQKPPALELARWHYEKAVAAGHPPNQELEKLLNGKAPVGAANP